MWALESARGVFLALETPNDHMRKGVKGQRVKGIVECQTSNAELPTNNRQRLRLALVVVLGRSAIQGSRGRRARSSVGIGECPWP